MKKIAILLTICLYSASFLVAQPEGETITRAEAEEILADKMINRVQEITARIDARLSQLKPIIKEMPASETNPTNRTLILWMQDGKAQKLEISEPGQETSSLYYFADEELFFVKQPFSRFIFIGGQLEYWLDDSWGPNRVARELLTQRENLLYDEVNSYLQWIYSQY